ncbi:MAG: hypothetical protein K0S46_1883 [Moraxellaceae bacterium]|jgi:hypothetical protein|nr:hypothetical protein [Moraxellaceae bacterium]
MTKSHFGRWLLALIGAASMQANAGANTANINCRGTNAGHPVAIVGAISRLAPRYADGLHFRV